MSEKPVESQEKKSRDKANHQQSSLSGEPTAEVVNVRYHDRDSVVMIDRSTIFGNPFVLEEDGGEYSRKESVEKYRDWFKRKIRRDAEFREAVENLDGEKLGCWCKPQDCHGDVIVEYLSGNMDIDMLWLHPIESETDQAELTKFFDD